MINYSVIIPHHNTPELLKKCLSSIPQRKDIQIIVVDDNSDPQKVDFANFPGKNRGNVEIIYNKVGKGAGHARNLALEKAVGKWLFFVDSDDYISTNGFDVLDRHVDSSSDIVFVGVDSVYIDTGKQANRHENIMKILRETKAMDTTVAYERLRLNHCNPIGKMIRRSIVGDIKFDEVWYSNDVMFAIRTGWSANSAEVDLETVYVITVSRGSLTNRSNLNSHMNRYEVTLRHNVFMREIGRPQYQWSIMNYYIRICRYGFKPFLKATKMMIEKRGNPFIGCKRWFRTVISIMKSSKTTRKYQTN